MKHAFSVFCQPALTESAPFWELFANRGGDLRAAIRIRAEVRDEPPRQEGRLAQQSDPGTQTLAFIELVVVPLLACVATVFLIRRILSQ